jgi:hypothetical protein
LLVAEYSDRNAVIGGKQLRGSAFTQQRYWREPWIFVSVARGLKGAVPTCWPCPNAQGFGGITGVGAFQFSDSVVLALFGTTATTKA